VNLMMLGLPHHLGEFFSYLSMAFWPAFDGSSSLLMAHRLSFSVSE